jgi:hypothetical protein
MKNDGNHIIVYHGPASAICEAKAAKSTKASSQGQKLRAEMTEIPKAKNASNECNATHRSDPRRSSSMCRCRHTCAPVVFLFFISWQESTINRQIVNFHASSNILSHRIAKKGSTKRRTDTNMFVKCGEG